MAEELVMPRLSDTMEQGTIGRWLKREGDAFAEGDVLAEIETDKALMEFQAYDSRHRAEDPGRRRRVGRPGRADRAGRGARRGGAG